MSAPALPTPLDCSSQCTPLAASSTPGPQGPAGADGEDGTDGLNAFTIVVDGSSVMPAEGDVVTVLVENSEQVVVGQALAVQFWGTMIATAVNSSPDSITMQNPEDTASGAYADNAAPGTVLPVGAKISPSGVQGVSGVVGSGIYLERLLNLSDLTNVVNARANLGLGSAALFTQGVANGQIPNVHDAGGIGANEFVLGTGLGLQGLAANPARLALGLGTAAVKDAGVANTRLPAVDQVAGLTNGDVVFATAAGLQTLTAAAARTALGITSSGGNMDMLVYQHQGALGTGGGTFTNGAWQTVPINTEVVDTGNHGSIAANQMTLAAGTYRYRYRVVGYQVDNFQGILYDATAAAYITGSQGSIGFCDQGTTDGPTFSFGEGRFTIGVASAIELRAQCALTQAANGFGITSNFTVPTFTSTNVWSSVELWRE